MREKPEEMLSAEEVALIQECQYMLRGLIVMCEGKHIERKFIADFAGQIDKKLGYVTTRRKHNNVVSSVLGKKAERADKERANRIREITGISKRVGEVALSGIWVAARHEAYLEDARKQNSRYDTYEYLGLMQTIRTKRTNRRTLVAAEWFLKIIRDRKAGKRGRCWIELDELLEETFKGMSIDAAQEQLEQRTPRMMKLLGEDLYEKYLKKRMEILEN